MPGFERFYTADKLDAAATRRGGQLLLGELNCTSCHQADKTLADRIIAKQAPLLEAIGSRVKPSHLRAMLNDPHGVKPGTTMPDLLAGKPEAERKQVVEALVHYLAATGTLAQAASDRKQAANGGKLYHQIGCVACHGPRPAEDMPLATSMPLGDLAGKYSIPSLAAFLQDPLKVRPSGRMPGLSLKAEEARDIAQFLLPDVKLDAQTNLAYRYYEGDWDRLPDFDKLAPKATGNVAGFDLGVAQRDQNFAVRFEGYLKIDKEADYTFYLHSDDGAKLWIADKLVVDNDGIHSPQTKDGKVKLAKGLHPLVAAVFNGGGGVELDVHYEAKDLAKQPLTYVLFLTPEGPKSQPAKAEGKAQDDGVFALDLDLAKQGRELFATLGCAACHTMNHDKRRIESKLAAPALANLNTAAGCLAEQPAVGAPHYRLAANQRTALTAGIQAAAKPNESLSPKQRLAHTLTTFNCYACHDRDQVGGVEEARNRYFETNQKEMGDEGRIPPSLVGVGAKLTPQWLKQLFANGAQDRPYMLTRMPKFGEPNLRHAVDDLAALDDLEPVETPPFSRPERSVKIDGRHIVGNQALGCIKCHNFKNEKATGIQAMNMTTMTARLKHDWFHRYLLNPQQFRPGTRMPSAWPNGQTFYKDLLDGSVAKQIEAVWLYLADGDKAAVPYGLGRQPIPLVADAEAVMYRNFIQGAGPRAIGVGYPEKANLAFDANEMRLAMIWQGHFIDAQKHWLDRGAGFQAPLGDNVVNLPAGATLAMLAGEDEAWPSQPPKEMGYKFRGYRLDSKRRPTFLYDFGPLRVEDFVQAVAGPQGPELTRTLTITAEDAAANKDRLHFRAAVGSIEPGTDGWYFIDGQWRVRANGGGAPRIRKTDKQQELLVPLKFEGQSARIVERFVW